MVLLTRDAEVSHRALDAGGSEVRVALSRGTPGTGTSHLPWPWPLRLIADADRKVRASGRR